jgi:hypothetical protein
MKKLSTSIKIKLFLLLLVIGQSVMAGPVGFVRTLKGNAFSLWNGKMKVLNPGDTLEDFSDIYTEEGSEIVLADYRDHSFHLAGGGHLKMIKGMIELQKGYLWIKSAGGVKGVESLFILTANAQVQFKNGEGVVSYDYSSEKTQALSVLGSMSIENSQVNYLREEIPEGHFSFVSKKYNQGAPRIATPIGEDSFKKVVSLFDLPRPNEEVKNIATAKRDVASIPAELNAKTAGSFDLPIEKNLNVEGKGKIKIMRTQTHQYKDLKSDYMSELKREKQRRAAAQKTLEPMKKSGVKMMMFGFDHNLLAEPKVKTVQKVQVGKREEKSTPDNTEKIFKVENKALNVTQEAVPERQPASKTAEKAADSTFEDSLNSQYKSQPKHNGDLGKLINELQNFDQDYSAQD